MEAIRGQKHSSEAKKCMKESIYWKKFLMKVAQQPQKPPNGSNQIWATTSGKKNMIIEATDLYFTKQRSPQQAGVPSIK